MRTLSLLVLLFILATPLLAERPANRWEYIGTDTQNAGYYLDVTTVTRPEPRVVVFWIKEIQTSGYETKKRFKMWCGNRKFMRIDEPNYRMQDIVPDGMMETFLRRLDRR